MRLWLCDWAVLAYCAVVALLSAASGLWGYALAHIAVAHVPLVLARFDRPGLVGHLRAWDALALVPVLFIMAMQIVHRVHPTDYDDVLMRVDGALGGIAVLKAMAGIERPWLTDAMKLAWMAYYPMPLLLGIPLYRLGREAFVPAKNALVAGWLASYLCYFAMPALGPGWHEAKTGVPQPKWEQTAVSSQAKGLIRAIEAKDPRHTFPSGHGMIAAMTAWYLLRHRRWAWAAAGVPIAIGVIASTIYLRYHYVIDVVAGLALAGLCVGAARVWANYESRITNHGPSTRVQSPSP